MAKAGTWIIAIHASDKDESLLCKVSGNAEDVKGFISRLILRAKEADKDNWDEDCSYESPKEIRQNDDGTLYGCACFYDYHIDYTAAKLDDIVELTDCQERRIQNG